MKCEYKRVAIVSVKTNVNALEIFDKEKLLLKAALLLSSPGWPSQLNVQLLVWAQVVISGS